MKLTDEIKLKLKFQLNLPLSSRWYN